MTCFLCRGTMRDAPTTFMVELQGCIVIVKNVPSQVCGQCEEVSYGTEVARKLERIVDSMRGAAAEIAVVNYPGNAA